MPLLITAQSRIVNLAGVFVVIGLLRCLAGVRNAKSSPWGAIVVCLTVFGVVGCGSRI
jgi:hypothetical protein